MGVVLALAVVCVVVGGRVKPVAPQFFHIDLLAFAFRVTAVDLHIRIAKMHMLVGVPFGDRGVMLGGAVAAVV